MNKYITKEVYFRLSYDDSKLLYPSVKSFIYIGVNLSDEDDQETWYFQYADDYARYGSFLESKHSNCKVHCLTSSDPPLLNSIELIKQLDMAETRRNRGP